MENEMGLLSDTDSAKMTPAIASFPESSAEVRKIPAAAFVPTPEFDDEGNPPLNDGRCVADTPGTWHVAACRSKHVKAYAFDLLKLSRYTDGAVNFFLPMQVITVRSACRHKRRYKSPLFTGLIFVCVNDDAVEIDPRKLTFRQFSILVPTSAQDRFRSDLSRVEQMVLTDPDHVEVWPGIREGQTVKIRSGPFMGLVGDVLTLDNGKRKLIVVLQVLGQAVTCDLDDNVEVEPI